ncbi:MAG TPA: hypothetical protein PKD61_36265, partial [Polyangiaceae bacterium]|nr:hypothetical protein [Polyangiaceae bacterium]
MSTSSTFSSALLPTTTRSLVTAVALTLLSGCGGADDEASGGAGGSSSGGASGSAANASAASPNSAGAVIGPLLEQ